ncbi:MAG: toll/interleukin-1 receptor domain-containing protein [Hyphomicrobiaceae bacterium]
MRVFLSYHTPDRVIALALKAAIEKALPAADVFVDQTHLRHGHLWQPALFEAIGRAQAFIVLVSNRLGDWQKVEYYEARDRKTKDDAFILLPVVVADRSKGPADNLPGLAQLHWIESTEPAAPDPLAKIIAALQSKELPKPLEPWRTINPYRGLVALDEQDADYFFGRDREAGEIVNHMIASQDTLNRFP